jgi:hypothetical protein
VALCGEILDDGEITPEEVLELGEWFKNKPGAENGWPGEILKLPVLAVCEDKKVNKTELRKISRMLGTVAVEIPQRLNDARLNEIRQQNLAKVSAAIKSFDLSSPKLPQIGVQFKVGSQTDDRMKYTVGLVGPTCNCPDWKNRRDDLPGGHPSRCCKHIIEAFNLLRPKGGYPGWLDPFFGCNWRPDPHMEWATLRINGIPALVSSAADRGWANAYVRSGASWKRFGYNVHEQRWSYGIAPDAGEQLALFIQNGLSFPSPKKSFFQKMFAK